MGSRLVIGVAVALAVAWLAWADGGYFPSAWGLALTVCGLGCLAAVLLRDELELGRLDLALVAGLLALAVWAGLSAMHSTADGPAVAEAERGLLYAAAAALLLLVVRRALVGSLLAGLVGGATAVAVYGLATRLWPGDVGGAYDPSAGYQLAAPIGYWNALGALVAIAVPLAVVLARGEHLAVRAASGATLVPLAAALYFTFSRGALVALAAGLVALIAVERDRLRLVLDACLLALAPAVAVALCAENAALTAAGATLQTAQEQGHALTWQLVAAGLAGALVAALALPRVRRLPLPAVPRRAALGAVGALAVGVVAVGIAAAGGPVDAVDRALDSFRAEPAATDGDLNRRLLSVSGSGRADYWRVASDMVEDNPLLGAGAGTFERTWLRERDVPHHARDAHNLYLETLAELGPLGLALLLFALAVPLVALRRARSHGLAAASFAGYVVLLVHAAVDWDWEVPAVALPGLACGAGLVVLARPRAPFPISRSLRLACSAGAAAVVLVGLVAHAGNQAVAQSIDALEAGDLERAHERARDARSWMPWAAEPWQLEGEARLAQGRDGEARAALTEAASRDPGVWSAWLSLAAIPGSSDAAIERAAALNPLSAEVRELREELRQG